jgi:hypothetical protein
MKTRHSDLGSPWMCLLFLAWILSVTPSRSQANGVTSPSSAQAETLVQITAMRDDFVRRTKSSGLACTLPPPRMEVRPVTFFGVYDEDTNTVTTTDWSLLSSEQKTPFFQMAGPRADEDSAHAAFEDTMHRSMLVHELAHWWEACHKVSRQAPLDLFQLGVQADRISVAYWRETNPALPGKVAAIAQGLIDHVPTPVPEGQSVQEYFNRNYEKIAPSIKPWFGAQLYLAAYREAPQPSLAEALALPSP